MPISRLRLQGYPADWPAIAQAVKERAHWHCQGCAVRHGAWGSRDRGGRFLEVDPAHMARLGHGKPPFRRRLSRGGFVRVFEVVLAAAHLNQTPSDCEPSNLRAYCQKCHLAHDLQQHLRNADRTRRAGMGTLDLGL